MKEREIKYENVLKEFSETLLKFPDGRIDYFNSDIKIDWEHTDYKWIKPSELSSYKVVPNLEMTLSKVL